MTAHEAEQLGESAARTFLETGLAPRCRFTSRELRAAWQRGYQRVIDQGLRHEPGAGTTPPPAGA